MDAPGQMADNARSRCRVCCVLVIVSLAVSRKGATLERLEERRTCGSGVEVTRSGSVTRDGTKEKAPFLWRDWR